MLMPRWLVIWAASRYNGVLPTAMTSVTADAPRAQVRGPSQIAVATLSRIGRGLSSAAQWKTPLGISLDISTTSPREIVARVTRDARLGLETGF